MPHAEEKSSQATGPKPRFPVPRPRTKDRLPHKHGRVLHDADPLQHKQRAMLHDRTLLPHNQDLVVYAHAPVQHSRARTLHAKSRASHCTQRVLHKENSMPHNGDPIAHNAVFEPREAGLVQYNDACVAQECVAAAGSGNRQLRLSSVQPRFHGTNVHTSSVPVRQLPAPKHDGSTPPHAMRSSVHTRAGTVREDVWMSRFQDSDHWIKTQKRPRTIFASIRD